MLLGGRFNRICGRKTSKREQSVPGMKRTEFLVQRKRTFEPVLHVHGPEDKIENNSCHRVGLKKKS